MAWAHLLIVTCLVLLIGMTAGAQPGTLKEVVPGVWFREGGEQGTGHCNNIIIEMKDYLVVVDANYPSGARAVIDDVKKISSKPIKYVIDTHHHQDHSYGNPIFTKAGAITIGHIGVLGEMKRYEPKNWRGVSKVRKDVAELELPAPEPPQQTYAESPFIISDSTRRIELHHFAWGHTRGDTFVYLPKEKIICTGDVVVNGPFSDPKHAYMGNWANEIRSAQKLDVEHVLPGHGKPGGKELLEGQIQFFVALYNAVDAAVKKGSTLEQLVTKENGRPVSTTIELPKSLSDVYVNHGPNLRPFEISRFPTQVMACYEEITQGKPYGEIIGGK